MKSDEFASLLCSRLCHDMISPVGAITNALELLDEDIDAETRTQVMALLTQSATQTSRKLQFFRLAFGAAGGFSETLDLREAQKAAGGLLDSMRVEPTWTADISSASKSSIKLLLCLILITAETLVRGGRLEIDCPDMGDGKLSVMKLTASGDRVVVLPGVETILTQTAAHLSPEPRTAPACLAALVAKELNLQITLNTSEVDAETPTVSVSVAPL